MKKPLLKIIFIITIAVSCGWAHTGPARAAELLSKPEFFRLIAMVYDARTLEAVADCYVSIGSKRIRTDDRGYFEISNMLSGDYFVTIERPPFEKYAQFHSFQSPLAILRIGLVIPPPEITEMQKKNTEYDMTIGRIMRMNTNEIMIGEEAEKPRKKKSGSSYYSPYGRSFHSGEGKKTMAFTEKAPGEISKAPKISTARGFGKLIGCVYENNGSEIKSPARIIIGIGRGSETEKSGTFEIHNIPVGTYDVTIKCQGYETRVDKGFKINGGRNKYDFFLTPAAKK
ncbi:MAG TPA: carboxypeptidase-like regulatory domain-containing protein [Candidatus Wallbacteria bacterium]|nr:carboxypeptidase-like regulatory domain-containing protein [Candidatus Wallbacteria bacterium]